MIVHFQIDGSLQKLLVGFFTDYFFQAGDIHAAERVVLVYPSRAIDFVDQFLRINPQLGEKVILCCDAPIPQLKVAQIKPHEWNAVEIAARIVGELALLESAPKLDFGHAPAMKELAKRVKKFAPSNEPVLILGETGTGKGMLGKALHDLGRNAASFGHVNVSALGDRLIPELFGHKRGSFTDAFESRVGLLVAAKAGSFLLDEIGDLTSEQQARMLDVIENSRVMPLGQGEYVQVQARLMFATWRDLEEMVAKGSFRQDLYYRIDRLVLRIPPLRERRCDILPLAQIFLGDQNRKYQKQYKFSNSLKDRLFAHHWPGNVRELQHVIGKAFAVSDGDQFAEQEIFDLLKPGSVVSKEHGLEIDPMSQTWDQANELLKLEYFKKLLEVIPSKTEAAKQAQMSKARFYEICKELNL